MGHYALSVPEYERQSIWGIDSRTSSVWAMLWRNGTDGDAEPELWVSQPSLDLAIRELSAWAQIDYLNVYLILASTTRDEEDQVLLCSLIAPYSGNRAWIEQLIGCGIDWVEDEAKHFASMMYPDLLEPVDEQTVAAPETPSKKRSWFKRLF